MEPLRLPVTENDVEDVNEGVNDPLMLSLAVAVRAAVAQALCVELPHCDMEGVKLAECVALPHCEMDGVKLEVCVVLPHCEREGV